MARNKRQRDLRDYINDLIIRRDNDNNEKHQEKLQKRINRAIERYERYKYMQTPYNKRENPIERANKILARCRQRIDMRV